MHVSGINEPFNRCYFFILEACWKKSIRDPSLGLEVTWERKVKVFVWPQSGRFLIAQNGDSNLSCSLFFRIDQRLLQMSGGLAYGFEMFKHLFISSRPRHFWSHQPLTGCLMS